MTPQVSSRPDSTVRDLGRRIDTVLGSLLPPGVPCALLDFPSHPNVGDSAIWLGETEWLRRHGHPVTYVCDLETYSRPRLAARLGDGVILLHGGGNLGDFWGEYQRFREQVIADFPANPIIQLPQTIHFLDEWGAGEARRVFDGHPNLTLLCRDRRSLRFARERFAAPSLLCPDMAFVLSALQRPEAPRHAIVCLYRTDAESANAPLPPPRGGVEQTDWLEEVPTPADERYRALGEQLARDTSPSPDLFRDLVATADLLARERLQRGAEILSRGKVVITDRLHGHILCLLLGIPHVLLDNNYGKVRGFYESWTAGSPVASWADSPAEALEVAAALSENSACPG
jgi:pyruvyl transferase EpsO